MYLGEVFGVDAGLYPALGPKRGEAMKWIVWSNVVLVEPGSRLAAALPPGSAGGVEANSQDQLANHQGNSGAADTARADIARSLQVLDSALKGRPFLLGDYSLADTHLQGFVGWLGMMDVDIARFPNVASWLRRCGERPALAALVDG